MIRWGLCCVFREAPIKFADTTAAAVGRLDRSAAREKLARLCRQNAASLAAALHYCAENGIGCFRVNSRILPLSTHPQLGYRLEELPGGEEIVASFRACARSAAEHRLRLSFHPDQFVVLNSPRKEVVEASIRELEHHATVAEWIGADVINIHAGGVFGDRARALAAFAENFARLSPSARSRLTIENDDKLFAPAHLLPLCRELGLPLVYDVHHHRCLPDGLSVEEATAEALRTWNREPLFHISSPLNGWDGPQPHRHHDEVAPRDFPRCWLPLDLTVEVEAKGKEPAVLKLKQAIERRLRRQKSGI